MKYEHVWATRLGKQTWLEKNCWKLSWENHWTAVRTQKSDLRVFRTRFFVTTDSLNASSSNLLTGLLRPCCNPLQYPVPCAVWQWCVALRGIVFSCVALCCVWCNNMPRCVKCCFQSCTCCAMCSTTLRCSAWKAPFKEKSERVGRGQTWSDDWLKPRTHRNTVQKVLQTVLNWMKGWRCLPMPSLGLTVMISYTCDNITMIPLPSGSLTRFKIAKLNYQSIEKSWCGV